jgi:hypothetical protein
LKQSKSKTEANEKQDLGKVEGKLKQIETKTEAKSKLN